MSLVAKPKAFIVSCVLKLVTSRKSPASKYSPVSIPSLGDDVFGNITRIDNTVERFADDLEKAKDSLADTKNQFETAQKEVQKPFVQEEELKSKLARLDELNILLNMDKKENEIVGGEPDEGESTEKRKEKSYER